MNTKQAALAVLAISGGSAPGLAACGQGGPPVERVAAIETGRAAWAERKAACPAYFYDRSTRRRFDIIGGVQIADITGVQIADDVPVWRSYFAPPSSLDAGSPPTSWIEEGADVGSHANGSYSAYPAYTVEQLYDGCEALHWRVRAPGFQVVVTDGVPHVCGWPNGDCSGIACVDEIDLIGFSCGAIDPAVVAGGGPGDAGTD